MKCTIPIFSSFCSTSYRATLLCTLLYCSTFVITLFVLCIVTTSLLLLFCTLKQILLFIFFLIILTLQNLAIPNHTTHNDQQSYKPVLEKIQIQEHSWTIHLTLQQHRQWNHPLRETYHQVDW